MSEPTTKYANTLNGEVEGDTKTLEDRFKEENSRMSSLIKQLLFLR